MPLVFPVFPVRVLLLRILYCFESILIFFWYSAIDEVHRPLQRYLDTYEAVGKERSDTVGYFTWAKCTNLRQDNVFQNV